MFDLERFQKNFAKDLSNMPELMAIAVRAQNYGSVSERRPHLGRMVRCPFCKRRRRQNATTACCNTRYATSQRGWDADYNKPGEKPKQSGKGFGPTARHEKGFQQVECPERVNQTLFSQKKMMQFIETLQRKNRPRHWRGIRTTLQRMRNEPGYLEACVDEISQRPRPRMEIPKPEHLPAFAEQFFIWKMKREKRRMRRRNG